MAPSERISKKWSPLPSLLPSRGCLNIYEFSWPNIFPPPPEMERWGTRGPRGGWRERERETCFSSLLDMGKEERPDKYANALLFCCRIPAVGWEGEKRRRRRRADRDKKLLFPLVQGRATGGRVGLVLIFSLSFS